MFAESWRSLRFYNPWRTTGLLAVTLLISVAQPGICQQRQPSALAIAAAMEQVVTDAIAKAEKSVVAIARVRSEEDALADDLDRAGLSRPLGPDPSDPDFVPHEFGTGVVVDPRGLILTQAHVVVEGDRHWVTTADQTVYEARIIASDPRSGLAMLAVEGATLDAIRIGDADAVRKGQFVVALGNPYGIAHDGSVSASWGIVANVGRRSSSEKLLDESQLELLHRYGTLIQTDAKLNLGTSGGALINLRGEMIGLTTSLAATAGFETAAGYAVPMNTTFRRVIETLKAGREVEYGLLGVEPENLSQQQRRRGQRGMRVRRVVMGSPAYQARLQRGDVITHVGDRRVNDAAGLILEVGSLPVETEVELTVERLGLIRRVPVKLAKHHVAGDKIVTSPRPVWRGLQVDYQTAMPIVDFERRVRLGEVDLEGCVLVRDVAEDSPAWQEGLRPGMFISHVGDRRLQRPDDFYQAVQRKRGPVAVRLTSPTEQRTTRTIPPEA